MAWLVSIATSLLTKLSTWAFTKALEWYHGHQQQVATEEEIDLRLLLLKEAFKKSFDGNPVTPEQREELKHAIRTFITGNAPSGGL